MKRIAQIEKSFMRESTPRFSSGDTLRVHVKIKEGDKERIQVFQGTVIGRRGGGLGETFTVRKISSGIGVERVFPLHSPNIARIEKVRSGVVRRAKLYYLRNLTGKSARIKEEIVDSSHQEVETFVTPEEKAAVEEKPVEEAVTEEAPAEAAAEATDEAPEAAAEPEADKTKPEGE